MTTVPDKSRWLYSGRMLAALQVAAQLHGPQVRTETSIPYLSHLLGACSIALEHGADEDQAIAALLHDAIEDVRPTEVAVAAVAAFGDEVLRLVEACTQSHDSPDLPSRKRRETYLGHLRSTDRAVLLVSASDKLHNARSILRDLRRYGDDLFQRFSAPPEQTLWYYRELVKAFRSNPAHDRQLLDELARVVTEIHVLASGAAVTPRMEDLLKALAPEQARGLGSDYSDEAWDVAVKAGDFDYRDPPDSPA